MVESLLGGDNVKEKGLYIVIDEDLHRLLKIKTMMEGKTLREWLRDTVKEYVRDLVESDFFEKVKEKNEGERLYPPDCTADWFL